MADELTPRLALPLLVPGQAQKEMTHNEALVLLDIAAQASVVAVGLSTPPLSPAEGACWIVGATPSGAWAGQEDAVAGWTAGGWRFLAPREGMSVWVVADSATARFVADAWVVSAPAAPISAPAGGSTTDAEARAAIAAILVALRDQGLVAIA